MRTVIIGGVAGGMSAATRLRRQDENMEIVVLEATNYVSFANCGLPYHVGGVIVQRDSLLLQTPQSLATRFRIDVRVSTRATAIDRTQKTVRFTSPAGEDELTYDYLILAPGASPIIPPIPGIERALPLRNIEDTDALIAACDTRSDDTPTAVVIGGGFVGLEVAENLTHRGFSVTVLDRADHILPNLDPEMAQPVAEHLRSHGITVVTGTEVTEVTAESVVASGVAYPADVVIASLGVRPHSALAADAGLEVAANGGIVVDWHQRTSDPAIFAVGDAALKRDAVSNEQVLVPLAQSANRHGRLVADVITGHDTASQPVLGTAIIGLFGMAAASTGWNETRARNAGRAIRVLHLHPVNHAGYYPGSQQIHLKLMIDAHTDAILGAQAVGMEGVDKRIDIIATAMRAGVSASELADLELAYAPQFGSAKDPINMAGFVAENIANGESTVQWHELNAYRARGWTLVDVRSAGEFATGAIPGAVNIPVDELRERTSELRELLASASGPDAGRVLVHCQVGLRGHIATSLLTGLGFDVANLDGGYLTWKAGTAAVNTAHQDASRQARLPHHEEAIG
ncbi:FAD-dependent oxidoreductase [Arcanobacterium canis]